MVLIPVMCQSTAMHHVPLNPIHRAEEVNLKKKKKGARPIVEWSLNRTEANEMMQPDTLTLCKKQLTDVCKGDFLFHKRQSQG